MGDLSVKLQRKFPTLKNGLPLVGGADDLTGLASTEHVDNVTNYLALCHAQNPLVNARTGLCRQLW